MKTLIIMLFFFTAQQNIVAIDTIDVNQKSVIDIYLKTWANGIFEFTQNQYDSLYQIAMQDEATGGFGVYGARVMLGIEPNFMNILKTTASIENIEPVESKMYPNPAKDEAYFDYYLEEGKQGELNIYNIVGQLLQKYILTANENHIVINTAKLGQGVYLYCLKVNNSIVTNDKFVILK